MQVENILQSKGRAVTTIAARASIAEAVELLNTHRIGAVVVMDKTRVAGILSERDVLTRVVTQELPPAAVTVEQVMTHDVICCQASDDLDDVSGIMKTHRIRHVPVCDEDGALCGIISIGDINALHATTAEQHIHFLNEYLYGRV